MASAPTLTSTSTSTTTDNIHNKPLTIGVFGGSFNPIHLGHALLAVTTQQTKDYVDQVVLVPVFRHAVKKNLLPFDDRLRMCQLAVQHFENITVSDVERHVGASNGAMLQGLKRRYPPGTRLIWICGDDFFHWMHAPKGLETLQQVDGLIVQRRLHRHAQASDRFYKDPINEPKVQQVALHMNLQIDYIYGELPHFSSTLVRRAPGQWRSFLTNAVVRYLDERPHLVYQLMDNLHAEAVAEEEQDGPIQSAADANASSTENDDNDDARPSPAVKKHKRSPSLVQGHRVSASLVLRGIDIIHALQKERGHTALFLSMGRRRHGQGHQENLARAQNNTDKIVQEIMQTRHSFTEDCLGDFVEAQTLAAELERIPLWIAMDRRVLQTYALAHDPIDQELPEAWMERLDLVQKFDARIDVLIGTTVRALTETLQKAHVARQTERQSIARPFARDVPELLHKWLDGKEALGRERAFICSGGPAVPRMVRQSLKLRERSAQTIDTKERQISRVLSLQADFGHQHTAAMTTPEALHSLLDELSRLEYSLLGTFGSSTSLHRMHRILAAGVVDTSFDVTKFFSASTAAIDFLLSFAKALTASALAGA